MEISIRRADFSNPRDRERFVALLDHYKQGPFGDGKPLSEEVRQNLAQNFSSSPSRFAFFAEADDEPVGLASCIESFSTFNAAPCINIHDLAVYEQHRGNGIGRKLLTAVKAEAESRGASSVTLEVRADNSVARGLYESFGFSGVGEPVNDKTQLFGYISLAKKP